MIYSMTGYGRAEVENNGRKITIEINSLNNRYCEILIRLPKAISHFESGFKEIIGQRVKRGKVLVSISVEESQEMLASRLELNHETAEVYYRIFKDLKKEFDLSGDLEIGHFAMLQDLIKPAENSIDEKSLKQEITECLHLALDDFMQMRAREGESLMKDIVSHIDKIEQSVLHSESSAQENIALYNEKLRARIKEMIGDMSVSEEMIANEAALVADKSDITEECVRIKSHLQMFRDAYHSDVPVGKKMNFILQELYREANTIGSKSISSEISHKVILMKEEIEKVREQIQNLE